MVVLQAGAEGGDVTLIGRTTVAGAWSFARVTDDQTEALFGDSGVEITAPPAAETGRLGRRLGRGTAPDGSVPWAQLHPLDVHPAFVERVRVAVEERLADVDSESAERATGEVGSALAATLNRGVSDLQAGMCR